MTGSAFLFVTIRYAIATTQTGITCWCCTTPTSESPTRTRKFPALADFISDLTTAKFKTISVVLKGTVGAAGGSHQGSRGGERTGGRLTACRLYSRVMGEVAQLQKEAREWEKLLNSRTK
ncbi:MAG: hypothetical protein NC080_06630 [Paraprevotella sp.]|nr:hypothetical protein [Paraprevotella sp.]